MHNGDVYGNYDERLKIYHPHVCAVFTALHGKQTRSIAMGILSVRLSVCPSVKRVHCDKTEESCI